MPRAYQTKGPSRLSAHITVPVTEDMKAELCAVAQRARVDVAKLVRQLIDAKLNEERQVA